MLLNQYAEVNTGEKHILLQLAQLHSYKCYQLATSAPVYWLNYYIIGQLEGGQY